MKKVIIAVLIILCISSAFIVGVTYDNNKKETSDQITVNDSPKDKSDSATMDDSKKELSDLLPTSSPSKEWKPNLITIAGKEYDLSDDFQNIVGMMVKDGISVSEISGMYRFYDENGKIIKGSGGISNIVDYIFATETDRTSALINESSTDLVLENTNNFIDKHGKFILRYYDFYDMENSNIISGLEISSKEESMYALNHNMFIKTDSPLVPKGDQGYTTIFVNGKPLDFSAYEEHLKELKGSTNRTARGILIDYFPHYLA